MPAGFDPMRLELMKDFGIAETMRGMISDGLLPTAWQRVFLERIAALGSAEELELGSAIASLVIPWENIPLG